MAQLDKKQAEVIRKYYFEEKTWPELQKEMHASSRTLVKRRDDGLTALMAMGQYMEGVMKEQVRMDARSFRGELSSLSQFTTR